MSAQAKAPGTSQAEKPKKRKYTKRKSAVQAGPKQRPLPPPIPIQGPQADPFEIEGIFPNPGVGSQPSPAISSTEPRPGQPLSPEAESILSGIDGIGEAESSAGESGAAVGDLAGIIPQIRFNAQTVEKVLREGFDWLADRFGSDHWKLTDNQAEMLGAPVADVLSSLFSKLPDFLTRWCDTTPGLGALVVAGAVVIGPKVATQMAMVREDRRRAKVAPVSARRAGPVPVGDAMPSPIGV